MSVQLSWQETKCLFNCQYRWQNLGLNFAQNFQFYTLRPLAFTCYLWHKATNSEKILTLMSAHCAPTDNHQLPCQHIVGNWTKFPTRQAVDPPLIGSGSCHVHSTLWTLALADWIYLTRTCNFDLQKKVRTGYLWVKESSEVLLVYGTHSILNLVICLEHTLTCVISMILQFPDQLLFFFLESNLLEKGANCSQINVIIGLLMTRFYGF